MRNSTAIPVIMYHTVGKVIPDWAWSFLTVPYLTFEDHLKKLHRAGYQTIDLHQLHAHVSGSNIIKTKNVVLTFDDGYLDNWTFVAPLLKKYGFKATVYINPEFVDPRNIIRPTLEDVWNGKCSVEDIDVRGFMSWEELKKIEEWGVFSVQSHLMSHTWYPISDEIVDYHRPDDAHYWLDWNDYPEIKPFYLMKPNQRKTPWGTPVYKNAKSMAAVRFYPDEKEKEFLVNYVKLNGDEKFFLNKNWKSKLDEQVKLFRASNHLDTRTESPEEQKKRLEFELVRSKMIIEENLKKKIDFMAWPGGGYSADAFLQGKKHYLSMTKSSTDKIDVFNRIGDDCTVIKRIGVPSFEQAGKVKYPDGSYFVLVLDEFRRVLFARQRRQLIKAINRIFNFIT